MLGKEGALGYLKSLNNREQFRAIPQGFDEAHLSEVEIFVEV